MESLFVGVLGLVVGSFLGALSYRLPKKTSIVKGRSFCPSCKRQIVWYDNIPLLSFLILNGRCRNCHAKISFREPLIELATAIVFVVVGFNLTNLILASLLITIFVTDVEYQIIPDTLVFTGLLVLISSFFIFHLPIFEPLLAGFISALLLLVLNLMTKGRGMGLGDVKLALLIGTVAGLQYFFTWLFFSFVAGAFVGIILLITQKVSLKHKIAFGPFLIIGLILTNYFGNYFLNFLS